MKGSNVLIVDSGDPGYIQDLQSEPYNIEIAESVPAAIEKIERGSFDAAVINIDPIGSSPPSGVGLSVAMKIKNW